MEQTVGRLDGRVESLEKGQNEMKDTLAGQDKKLDQLLQYHHEREGAIRLLKVLLTALTSTGFLGWAWEHFHK